jgi:uncharacterized membrane protein
MMPAPLAICALLSLLMSGAIFGFFYAWLCSTMWGLDTAEPTVAIAAMQAMNASVRNIVFFPAFFGTPAILAVSALVARAYRHPRAGWAFGAAALVYFAGAFLVTMTFNVPMNTDLASVAVPPSGTEAARIWQDYSVPWQFWNGVRTIACAIALLLTGYALLTLGRDAAR